MERNPDNQQSRSPITSSPKPPKKATPKRKESKMERERTAKEKKINADSKKTKTTNLSAAVKRLLQEKITGRETSARTSINIQGASL